ncbi:rhombosortase [Marinobacter sp. CHS3-4]|uniref:rhombosortase n=1 Tax=Marinobacter sp. CHS3-4 TaxID=3045174 RepID=UPI0024B5118A|nr:rhombosortase [Marinobacter sp. CHS3-4]MDI9244489.1 rhombosortase [Marinobacter sp. CHS3-4]
MSLPTLIKTWSPLLATAVILVALQMIVLMYPPMGQLLEWSRVEIAQGQWWRLLTGHWVHLGPTHLLLNLAGLFLLSVLFDRPATTAWWAGYLLTAPVAISFALEWAIPALDWYRGFSGCLHGLFVLLAMANLSQSPRWNTLLLVGLGIKLVAEAFYPTGTADLIGAAVIYQAHWLGALTGVMAGCVFLISRKSGIRETPGPPSPG